MKRVKLLLFMMIALYGAIIGNEQNCRLSTIKGTTIYSHDFSELGNWTIINGPGVTGATNSTVTWVVPGTKATSLFTENEGSSPATYKAAYIGSGSLSHLHDDWLISPTVTLEAGKKYSLSADLANLAVGTLRLEIYIGNGNTIADQTTQLIDYSLIANTNLNPGNLIYNREFTFSVPNTGAYNIGFRNTSWGGSNADFYMSNVKVVETEDVITTPYFHDFKTFSGWVTTNITPNYPTTYPGGSASGQGFDIPSQSSATLKNPFDLFAGDANTTTSRHAAAQLNKTVASGKPHKDWLISPAIRLESGKTYTVDFDLALQANGTELLKIFVGNGYAVSNMTTELDSYTIVASATGDAAGTIFHKRVEFNPTVTADYNFGFYDYSAVNTCGNLLISNFDIKEKPAVNFQKDLAVVNVLGETTILADEAANYVVNIVNLGDETQNNYTVQLVDSDDNVISETVVTDNSIEFNQSKNITVTWTPDSEMDKVVFAKVVLEGDEDLTNNKTTESLSIAVKGHYVVNGKVTNRVFTTLEGCDVRLTGFREYATTTSSDGTFSFPAVYTADNYTIKISKMGYNDYIATFKVEKQNLDLGSIVLVKKGGYGSIYTHDFSVLGDWTIIDDYPGETSYGSPCTWMAPSVGPYGNPFPTTGITNQFKNVTYSPNDKRAANDWLISPSFTLTGGETYKMFFDVAVDQFGNENFKVTLGQGITADVHTTVLGDYQNVTNKAIVRNSVEFTIPESGNYNIGFHCYSTKDQGSLMISNIDLQGMIADELFKDLAAISFTGETNVSIEHDNLYNLVIENKGIEPQSNFVVQLIADSYVVDTRTVSDIIAPSETMNVSLTYNTSVEGAVHLTAKILLDLDEDTSNNVSSAITVTASNPSAFQKPGAPTAILATRAGMVVTVSWNAPTEGIDGGLFDASTLTYKVTRLPDYIVVADNLTTTTFTETFTMPGTYGYRIMAKNALGDGGAANSNNVKVGGSYSVPYAFKFNNLNEWTVLDVNADNRTWQAPAVNPSAQTYPWGGNNSAQYPAKSPLDATANDWIISPAIEMIAGVTYRIKFETCVIYSNETSKLKLTIGNNKTVAAQSTVLGNYTLVGPADHLVAREKIEYFTPDITGDYYVGFLNYDKGCLLVDEFEVTAGAEKDMTAISIRGANIIKNNAPHEYTVTVQNKGSQTQSEFEVQLIDGDQKVLAIHSVTEKIAPNERKDIKVVFIPHIAGDIVVFGKVVLVDDETSDNDRTPSYTEVKIRDAYDVIGRVIDNANAPLSGANVKVQGFYAYTAVTDADGTFILKDVFTANNYVLKVWEKGYTDYDNTFNITNANLPLGDLTLTEFIVSPYGLKIFDNGIETERTFKWSNEGSIFDDFEEHTPFIKESSGRIGWSYIDGDDCPVYEIELFRYPGYTFATRTSYMVLNPFQTIPPVNDEPGFTAHSGQQYIVSMACVDPTNEDFIISPKLNFGVDFKISFWAKSATNEFGLERFQVGYSTTGNAIGDFTNWVQLGLYEEAPIYWGQFSYNIPAEAKYVTIKCVSDDAFIFLVDDIFIGVEESASKSFTKYEVYLDGAKVTETTDRSYEFTGLSLGNHVAGVKAIYSTGETELKTIEFVTANKYIVTINNCPGGTLLVKSGNTTITNGIGVDANTPLSITATPDGGYNLTSLTVNDVEFVSGGTYIVNTNVEIAVVFTQKVWNVTIQQPEVGGTIEVTANGNVVNSGSIVPNGTQLIINNNPDDGYKLKQIKINGIAITGNKYTVVKDVIVTAEFMIVDGVEDAARELSIKTYPNPVKDVLNIEGEYNSMEIYDISGKIVESINSMESQINIEKLPSAIYILKINIGEKQIMRRVIKQ